MSDGKVLYIKYPTNAAYAGPFDPDCIELITLRIQEIASSLGILQRFQ